MGKLGQTGTHGFRASACVKERECENDGFVERLFGPVIPSVASAVEECLAISFLRIIRDVSTALGMKDSR